MILHAYIYVLCVYIVNHGHGYTTKRLGNDMNSWNTEKNPGDPKRLAVSKTPVKDSEREQV